jgi:CHAT domain-containing protein
VEFVKSRLGEGCRVLLGSEATEGRFRAEAKGKRILHLATHGRVRGDLMRGLRGRKREAPVWLGADMERQLAAGYDPMLLASLAFAGANPRDGAHGDDGILTAAEVSHLDLDGVDLVVLSACETALGTAESGEGVIGLVQGFQMAGAARVIASLWRVDDEATRLLMQHLYDGMLCEEDPLSAAEALRAAAQAVRGSSGAGGRSFAAPKYWAAFACYGR